MQQPMDVEAQIAELEDRIEHLETTNETDVRVVETDNGPRIVLEDRQQTWFPPKYFRKILDRLDDEAG